MHCFCCLFVLFLSLYIVVLYYYIMIIKVKMKVQTMFKEFLRYCMIMCHTDMTASRLE